MGYRWGGLPADGIHVGGEGNCGPLCNLQVHDVIISVDGAPVSAATELYELLSDEKAHKLGVWRYGSPRSRVERVRVDADDLRSFGFASVNSLASIPMQAQGDRRGFMIPPSQFWGDDHKWDMPGALWGQVYIVVDLKSGKNVAKWFSSGVDDHLDRLSLPMFVLGVGAASGGERPLPVLPEQWRKNTNIISVNTYYEPVGTLGRSGYLRGVPVHRSLNIMVVDCHGVIRWDMDYPFIHSFDDALIDAVDFALDLEQERSASACWTGRQPTETAARERL